MPALVILAAGLGRRFGGWKQLARVGPSGETLMHYAIYDGARTGFDQFVIVIRPELDDAFRAEMLDALDARVPVTLVHQDAPPAGRVPWGTGHAVLAAEQVVQNTFAVVNADDFYGRPAYRRMAAHLARGDGDGGLAGYRLGDTLSAAGGVSRAVCGTGADGFLTGVTEVRGLAESAGVIRGRRTDGTPMDVPADALVSLNFWGLPGAVFPGLHRRFEAFRASGPAPDDEFLLSSAIDDMIRTGELRVRVFPVDSPYAGITRGADQEIVVARLRDLTEAGAYPADLVYALRGRN